ncbi:MAG: hypothetical protein NT169_22545, partial [Chloroflexi bacterium]|nr:hypothetical protein [Chloroflexota bacterium]
MRRYPFVRRGLLASAIALTLFGLFLIPFALASAPQVADAPTPSSPEQAVQTAWQRAQQAGAYRFTTRVVQTTHPAPAIANVGTGSRVETVYLEGDADLPAETLLLHLWQDGGRITDASSGVEVRIEGDRAYGRAASGEWQEMDNVAGSFAPNNDLLAYLAGVKNVREISDFGFQISDAAPDSQSAIRNPQSAIRQYVFDLDGPAFANHVRAQLEERLRSTGELPAGLQLDTPDSLRRAVGKGEVWIDGDSLPLRLTMHIEYPQQRNGERVEADIQTDFSNFPRQMLAQADSRSFQQNFGSLLRDGASAASQAGVGLTLLGLMLGMVIHRRSRKVYAVVVWVIILAMVIAPLLQSQQVYAWGQKQSARQVESEQRQGAQEAERQYQQEMSGASWDPQRDPLANGQMANQQMGKWANQQINNTQYAVRNPQSAIRNQQSSVPQATPEPTSDDDGDGLTYAQEIRLGADPNEADTDGDRITDKAEVAGFFYNNRWWYSDPKSPDTNNDGQLDTLECWAKVVDPDAGEISPNETVACKDSDGDGTPDLFDRDDDGDGVPDAVDLSPYDFNNNGGRLFDADHPLLLQVDGLQAGKPAFVDFQLRPENADHLWYALNVLDWPSGDEDGQIQRKAGNDSTFEDVAVKGDPVAANAGNGDMRLIPMLEIKMTGDTFPLKFTTPEIAVGFKVAITATVHFGQAGNNIALDFSLDSGGVYDVTINERACQNLGDDLVTFPGLSDGASRTILNQKLTGLADGKHGLVLTGAGDKFCLDIGNVVNGPFADQMVDRKPLDPYGITVREGDDDGTLLAYSPLNLVADETGSDRTAFAGRMAYRPTTDQWGDTQKVNVVWVIQMLTDHRCNQAEEFAGRCTEDEWVLDTLQIVRAYPETWYLTGMAAREDHGVDIAVVYEDPAQEAAKNRQYDDQLWNLAWGLDKSFLTGRDQNGDGQRDITTAEIHARWDYPTNQNNGYANGDDKLWGVPITATRVVTFAYDLQDQYIHLAMTETKKILNDAFLDYVNAGSDAPTLLFTQESRYRSSDLGDDATTTEAVSDTVKVTLDLDPAKSQEETQVSMSWAPYRYEAGEWKSYPIDEYWDKIEVRYEEVFDEYQDDPAYEDIRRGQVFIAKMFYLAMYHGSSALVQVGDDLVGYQGSVYTDVDLEELLAAVDEAGGVTVRVTKALANVFAGMVGGVFEEVDLRAFLAGVHKIDPNGTYSTLFKHYRSEVNKGHLKDGAVAMLTAAVMAGYILAEALDIEPLTHALNVSVAFFSLYTLASAGVALYKTGKAVVPIAKAVAIGFLITELVTWGLFAYQLFASGLKPGSMAA